MTIAQLQYAIAVSKYKSFNKAAEYCQISQSTLSMQIKKLEQSLGTRIFDRSKNPIELTQVGEHIINQAKLGLSELDRINDIVASQKSVLPDTIKIGIIPTLSPYLIPLFLMTFVKKYPKIKVSISELQTDEIVDRLCSNKLDFGLLVTPLENTVLNIRPLFYEPFLGYISKKHSLSRKAWIQAEDLNLKDFWLLESGHCFREQVLKICKNTGFMSQSSVQFESGSLETLRNLVDTHHGYTLLPQLATLGFNEQQQSKIRGFRPPIPVREVSIVCHQNCYKAHVINLLFQEIRMHLPSELLEKGKQSTLVPIMD